jgi:hypothetical protein
VAWLEANRGTAIDDRATLAAFMDQEAAAFAVLKAFDRRPRRHACRSRGDRRAFRNVR